MLSLRVLSGRQVLTSALTIALPLTLAVVACEKTSPDPAKAAPEAIAYYFHNTIRCESCIKIEKCSRDALDEQFGALLESGALDWRMVNMELEENEHFVKDYDLGMPTLVLSRLQDGKETGWKNLEGVWEHLDDVEAMRKYVVEQTVGFLGAASDGREAGESSGKPKE